MKRVVIFLIWVGVAFSGFSHAQGVRTASLEYRTPVGERTRSTQTRVCPASVTVKHRATDGVSPVDHTITYEVVQTSISGNAACWITQNLGAMPQSESSGWYWQFNRKQGFAHDTTGFIPSSGWSASISGQGDWESSHDPCHLLLGTGWHIPTKDDWTAVSVGGGVTNLSTAYSSVLRLYASPYIYFDSETTVGGCSNCLSMWSSTTVQKSGFDNGAYGYTIGVDPTIFEAQDYSQKKQGLPVRCMMEL